MHLAKVSQISETNRQAQPTQHCFSVRLTTKSKRIGHCSEWHTTSSSALATGIPQSAGNWSEIWTLKKSEPALTRHHRA
uniref:Uncharacterized protein n=1 Tax=Kalanchoe fedtschenkoi TaxID=63787 RepID=A0A7N0VEL9_KALFE